MRCSTLQLSTRINARRCSSSDRDDDRRSNRTAIETTCLPSSIDAPSVRRDMSSTPHDALFKAVFSHPEHARGALRSVVPAAMVEALDWSTLALQLSSFQLRKRFGVQVNADTERRVAAASSEQIGLWADRVLSAVTLAELFAD
jgi:hypothetical protein